MKIIKKGKEEIKVRPYTCFKCGCVFEYERKDLRYDQREPQPWVCCPWCGAFIAVTPWKEYMI